MIFCLNSLLVLRMAPTEGDVFQLKKVKALLTLKNMERKTEWSNQQQGLKHTSISCSHMMSVRCEVILVGLLNS